eukprot:Nk52_evm17s218 gene=Nk52_evmTU17s218
MEQKLQEQVAKLREAQKEYQKLVAAKEQYGRQLHENEMVLEASDEIKLMEDGDKVFKLVGPVLVKQEVNEASQNVEKRLEFINGELKRLEKQMADSESQQETLREDITKIQQKYQAQMQKASA